MVLVSIKARIWKALDLVCQWRVSINSETGHRELFYPVQHREWPSKNDVIMEENLQLAAENLGYIKLDMVSLFLEELFLVEYVMLRYPPSMLAAAAVYAGQFTLRRFPSWNRTIECYIAYSEDQLQIQGTTSLLLSTRSTPGRNAAVWQSWNHHFSLYKDTYNGNHLSMFLSFLFCAILYSCIELN